MKSVIFFAVLLALSGCAISQKSKIYRNKISFYQSGEMKVLYAEPEEKKLPDECYKINFPDMDIAEKSLQLETMRRLNEYNQAFIPKAQKELKEVQKFLADLKAKISERAKQYKQLKELQKSIKESNDFFKNRKL